MKYEYDDIEEDVIIEGSDLHKALIDIGCTDFECISVNRSESNNVYSEIKSEDLSLKRQKWHWNIIDKIKNCYWLFNSKIIINSGLKEIEIISQLQPLLDDHSLIINNILEKNQSTSNKGRLFKWPIFIVTNFILATGTLSYKSLRISGLIAITFVNTLIAYRTYIKLYSINNLKQLVTMQNNIYNIYKKTLRIIKNEYCINKSRNKFNNINIERLKYLQPICEYFIQSIENITRVCHKISLLLINYCNKFCNNDYKQNSITNIDVTIFTTNDEITYEKLKQNYYIYILVQSEMMQLLAIIYQNESVNNNYFNSKLTIIIDTLLQLFKSHIIKLNNIIDQYKNTKNTIIRHELKNNIGNKLQDLYVHVDLLSRKIQLSYNICDSIIDDIDNCTDDDKTIDIIDIIIVKMNNLYKEIDTARNFAEFNNLLMNKIRHNRTNKNYRELNQLIINKIDNTLPIVHDNDPVIIDEVFEEYIKDEYLKPLNEDNDIDISESDKLDKLLAMNFMSELKQVLIDKYKIMLERETKALLSYRKKINCIVNDENVDDDNDEKISVILSQPPPPPPLPQLSIYDRSNCLEHIKIRRPVPLPRSAVSTLSPIAPTRRKIQRDINSEIIETNKNFLMNINMDICKIKLPIVASNEETFIGSGENSDNEIISDNESDNYS